jgi:hypothetical protein
MATDYRKPDSLEAANDALVTIKEWVKEARVDLFLYEKIDRLISTYEHVYGELK